MKRTVLTLIMIAIASIAYSQSRFSSVAEANMWIYDHINHVNVAKTLSEAQTPEETLRFKRGNCVDMTVLLLYYVERDDLYPYKDIYYLGMERGGNRHLTLKVGYLIYDPTGGTSYWSPEQYGYNEFYRRSVY